MTESAGMTVLATSYRSHGELLRDFPVQLLAPVDHGEERQDLGAVPLELVDEVGQLLKRPHRKRRRDERDHHDVGGVQHILRDQRDGRRAVEEDRVVGGAERGEQLGQRTGGLAAWRVVGPGIAEVQQQVHVPVGEIRRDQVEVVEVCSLDGVVEQALAADDRPAAALDLGLDPEHEARRALRVQVPQDGAQPGLRREIGEVDRRRGLPDAALDVIYRINPHLCGTSPEAGRTSGAALLCRRTRRTAARSRPAPPAGAPRGRP